MITLLLTISLTVFTSFNWISFSLTLSLILLYASFYLRHNFDLFALGSRIVWDTFAVSLIILRVWITLLIVISSWQVLQKDKFKTLFLRVIGLLLTALSWTFRVTDFLQFYILFEASLVPTFMLILGWGYQPERIQAGVYILVYTLFASLPLLFALLVWKFLRDSLNIILVSPITSTSLVSSLWLISFIAAFSVKLPLYIVHLWLPKAHVEAPVAGSIMLAGVLLKLGGYGLIRLVPKLNAPLVSINWILISWSIIGGVIVRLICIRQTDIKFLIALSSVAHMSIVIGGLLTLSNWGLNGAIFIIIGHGFCSSGLFCIANIAYERTKSRRLLIIKGIQSSLPSLTLWWFLLAISNIAAPPSLNLLGEMNSIIALFRWSWVLAAPLAWLTFFAAVYSLYIYSSLQHGKPSTLLFRYPSPSPREFLILTLHWVPLNIIILTPLSLQAILCFNNLY